MTADSPSSTPRCARRAAKGPRGCSGISWRRASSAGRRSRRFAGRWRGRGSTPGSRRAPWRRNAPGSWPAFPFPCGNAACWRFCCAGATRSEEHTSELQSQSNLVCRLLLEKKKINQHDSKRDESSGGVEILKRFGLPLAAVRMYASDFKHTDGLRQLTLMANYVWRVHELLI